MNKHALVLLKWIRSEKTRTCISLFFSLTKKKKNSKRNVCLAPSALRLDIKCMSVLSGFENRYWDAPENTSKASIAMNPGNDGLIFNDVGWGFFLYLFFFLSSFFFFRGAIHHCWWFPRKNHLHVTFLRQSFRRTNSSCICFLFLNTNSMT